jgi:hypothetical protein
VLVPGSGDVSFCGVVLNTAKRQPRKVLARRRGIGSWPLAIRLGTFEG